MSASLGKFARRAVSALLCAAAVLAAGCHNNNNTSGYGIAWVSLTDQPGDYTSYVVAIDSVTLTDTSGNVVTAASVPEIVNVAQLSSFAELWSSTGIPNATYVSATLNLDYTNAGVTVMVNGLPQTAKLVDYSTGATPTTYSVTVKFDPANPLVITPTYASTSAQRLAIDFNLAASGRVDLSTNPATVYVRPYITAGVVPDDTKLLRVRGPLINSNLSVGTYTVYVRPFYDEANNIGTVTLFNQSNTIYTINGHNYVGDPGLNTLSVLPAGSTIVAAFTTFQPTVNTVPSPPSTAGKFNLVYVVGASSLEDQYTEGLSGDVIKRVGDTVTLLGSTLFLNTANTFSYEVAPTQLLLGPGTIVTADDNSTLTGLNSSSVAVGQHISARGIYSQLANGTVQLDATGTSSTNTGSVRLQTTEFWGSLVSTAAAGLVMNLNTINDWPVSDYDFAGNGTTGANNPSASAFSVNTAGLTLPIGTAAGDPVWVNGFLTRFGSAPPDLDADAANNQLSVQTAGGQASGAVPTTPGVETCGVGSQVCNPASLQVIWTSPPGTVAPFVSVSSAGFTINLSQAELLSAVIRIGPQSIDLTSVPAVMVVPTTLPVTSTFSPRYAFGNPGITASTTTPSISVYSNFSDFIAALTPAISATNPLKQLQATGVYDAATNTFVATSINFVL
ncbi:MAG: hypothetical protein ACLQKH_01700 [Steroidobacteraceae bacterium]